jgi:diguanylate cyclase (GGDEF)-like protein
MPFMNEDLELLTRRYERSLKALAQAEQIAEERSLELFLKGQELNRVFAAEQLAKQSTELLLRALTALSSKLNIQDILALFQQFINQVVLNPRITIFFSDEYYDLIGTDVNPVKDIHYERIDRSEKLRLLEALHYPFVTGNASTHTELTSIGVGETTASIMGLSLTTRGKCIGFVLLESDTPDEYTTALANLAQALADETAITLENARLYQVVEKLSTIDPLTGLSNRRHLEALAAREIKLSGRSGHPLSLLMLDIDHFKRVNDTYGHETGDKVLVGIADTCRKSLRTTDICARFGGEEFVFLCPDTDSDHALNLAERVRKAVSRVTFTHNDIKFGVTVSLGVSEVSQPGDTLESAIQRADQALYDAKNQGRNRVVLWENTRK